MKIISAFLFATTANAFQVHQARAPQTALKMGFFDFKPMHGSGSGASENEIDEQYKLQQEMLEARRDHINHEALHDKYSQDKQDLDVFALGKNYEADKYQETRVSSEDAPKKKNKKEKKKGFKFFNMKP